MATNTSTPTKPLSRNAQYRNSMENYVALQLKLGTKAAAKATVDAVLNALAAITSDNQTTQDFRLQLKGLGTISNKRHPGGTYTDLNTGEYGYFTEQSRMHFKFTRKLRSITIAD